MDNEEINSILKKYNGGIDDNWYTENGFGLPVFNGENPFKTACTFIFHEKQNIINILKINNMNPSKLF